MKQAAPESGVIPEAAKVPREARPVGGCPESIETDSQMDSGLWSIAR